MDYTSFAPGNKSIKPGFKLPELPPLHRPFTHKFLGTVLIIAALAGAVAYGIWMWGNQIPQDAVALPSPSITADPSVDWKTYTNPQYGFSFKYPNNFAIKTDEVSADGGHYDVKLVSNRDSSVIEVDLDNNRSDVSTIGRMYGPTGTEMAAEKMTFGQNTFYYYGAAMQWHYPEQYAFNLNGKILTFDFLGPDPHDQSPTVEVKKMDGQILSTFQFTTPVDTSTWKTYTNAKYGYSVQYPASWEWSTYPDNADGATSELRYIDRGAWNPDNSAVNVTEGYAFVGGKWFLAPDTNTNLNGMYSDSLFFQVMKPDPVITLDQFVADEEQFLFPNIKKENHIINGLNADHFIYNYTNDQGIPLSYDVSFIKDEVNRLVYLFTQTRDVNNSAESIIATFKKISL